MRVMKRMIRMRGGATMRTISALIWSVIAIVTISGLYMISGGYNVGAMEPHTRPSAWLLNTTKERSVRRLVWM